MWIPPRMTRPPFLSVFKAAGTSSPAGAKIITASSFCGGTSNDGLFHELRRHAPSLELHLVGDAASPRQIERAIYEGHMAAREL